MSYSLTIKPIANVAYSQIISLFSRYHKQDWSFLLDSCEQPSEDANFDILAFNPLFTFEFKHGKQTIKGDWANQMRSALHSDCPFTSLINLQSRFNKKIKLPDLTNLNHLPFLTGALSAFGYDLNNFTDQIQDRNPSQYELPDISVGFYGQTLIYEKHASTAYICCINPQQAKVIESQLLDPLAESNEDSFNLIHEWQSNITKAQYTQKMHRISDYLHAGDCYQVNFAQRFHTAYIGCEWAAYQTLKKVNKAPFSAFVRLPQSTILSVSPERFLLVKDNLVETKPIKGTRKRAIDPAQDKALSEALLASPKDKAENLMIVDLLRNDLSKHCQSHSVKVPKLFALESFPAVHHMVSTVVGKLKPDSTPYNLLQGAFPGGSITGAPKVRAMQIIQVLEPDKRAIYCGSIGYIGVRNDMDTNICIRTLLAEKGQLYCWAGGGIVIDSEINEEYQESLDKVAKILPILAKSNAHTNE